MIKTIRLEDRGQDFLEWDINEGGMVIGCRPFQSSIWIGTKVLNQTIAPGDTLTIITKQEDWETTLNYPVASVSTELPKLFECEFDGEGVFTLEELLVCNNLDELFFTREELEAFAMSEARVFGGGAQPIGRIKRVR